MGRGAVRSSPQFLFSSQIEVALHQSGSTLRAMRAVLRRSTMFIALNYNHSALQRSAMCTAIHSFTCRSYGAEQLGMTTGYKHSAPLEHGSSQQERLCAKSAVPGKKDFVQSQQFAARKTLCKVRLRLDLQPLRELNLSYPNSVAGGLHARQ